MSKKQRVSPIASFQIDTDIIAGDLPNATQVEETVATLTGKTIKSEKVSETAADSKNTEGGSSIRKTEKEEAKVVKQKETKPEPKKKEIIEKAKPEIVQEIKYQIKYGRPQKEIATGRTKFTTMLQPNLIKQLKRQAIDKGITVADLLESILDEYMSK